MTINFNVFTSRRDHYLPLFFHFVKRMKPANRARVHVSLLVYGDPARYAPTLDGLRAQGVAAKAVAFRSEYLEKTLWAVHQPFPYSAKIDEDVFLNEHALDFIVENISVLDDPAHTAVSPIFSNGIPTCDRFLAQVFSDADREALEGMFLATRFGRLWGYDYAFLNRHTVGASRWDPEAFYRAVAAWPHPYKGIHPVRVNPEAQIAINERILARYTDAFAAPRPYAMTPDDHPYLCNNLFFIKTEKWRRIVQNISLYVDPFDEVPLSRHKQRKGERWVIVDRSFGIHTVYNTVYGHRGLQRFEDRFVEGLKQRLMP